MQEPPQRISPVPESDADADDDAAGAMSGAPPSAQAALGAAGVAPVLDRISGLTPHAFVRLLSVHLSRRNETSAPQ